MSYEVRYGPDNMTKNTLFLFGGKEEPWSLTSIEIFLNSKDFCQTNADLVAILKKAKIMMKEGKIGKVIVS